MPGALRWIINICWMNDIPASQGSFFIEIQWYLVVNIGEGEIWSWPDFSSLKVTCFPYRDLKGFLLYSWYSKFLPRLVWVLVSFHSFCQIFIEFFWATALCSCLSVLLLGSTIVFLKQSGWGPLVLIPLHLTVEESWQGWISGGRGGGHWLMGMHASCLETQQLKETGNPSLGQHLGLCCCLVPQMMSLESPDKGSALCALISAQPSPFTPRYHPHPHTTARQIRREIF